jgi:RNA polymerase sigma-70 factor (ECF subfamily)
LPWAHHTLSILNTINLQTIVYKPGGEPKAFSSQIKRSRVDAYLSSVGLSALPSTKAGEEASTQLTAVAVTSASDEQLMSRLNGGERDAIAELFRRHSGPIYRFGRKILRDSGEADDLVQEVFLYVFRRSELFDPSKGTARSWIFQIAYTQALLKRRKLKAIGFYSSAAVDDGCVTQPSADLLTRYEMTVEGLFGRNGWKRIVQDLTAGERETFRLHFFEGYTFAEIAKKLGQSYANIRNHHYRGLEKVRRRLADNPLSRR